ncbi:DUF3099 domain-containing protein [Micrococcus luteus]
MAATTTGPCGPAAVQSVTTAPQARSADRDERMRRYLIQMGIRTACFIGAFFAHGWLQIVLFAAAAILPYIAVVGSNNARPYTAGTMQSAAPPVTPLTADPAPTRPEEDVVAGEVVEQPRALPPGAAAGPGTDPGRSTRPAGSGARA